jgi:hypothetical protein
MKAIDSMSHPLGVHEIQDSRGAKQGVGSGRAGRQRWASEQGVGTLEVVVIVGEEVFAIAGEEVVVVIGEEVAIVVREELVFVAEEKMLEK